MRYYNNVENGFSVTIDEEGNFEGVVRNCPTYKTGMEITGNVHSLTMRDECVIDGIIRECFDMRTRAGKEVYNALLCADDEVAEEATEEEEEEPKGVETKMYTIRDEFPETGKDTVEGYNYVKAKTGAEIREEPEQTFYDSMYGYVQGADFSDYEIADGEIRVTPFVDDIEPANDPDFVIGSESMEHEGKWYRKVNFGENEESYLLESALYDAVYLRYIETDYGHYVSEKGRAYETREEAENKTLHNIETRKAHGWAYNDDPARVK